VPPGPGPPADADGEGDGEADGEADGVGVADFVTVGVGAGFVVFTGTGFFVITGAGRVDPFPVLPTRVGVVATMPAGTWISEGLVLVDALLLPEIPEMAGDVAAG